MIEIPRKKANKKTESEKRKTKSKPKKKEKKVEEEKMEMPSISELLSGDFSKMSENCLMTDLLRLSWEEVRTAPQDVINNVVNPETITHFIRAGLEVYDVVQNVGPGGALPDNTKFRMYRAERELLLAVTAAMNRRLKDLEIKIEEEGKKCEPGGKSTEEMGLKEIKIED